MPGLLHLSAPRLALRAHTVGLSAFVLLACATVIPARASGPRLEKYPLRVHVLASDETHMTPRMRPGEAVACDGVDAMVNSIDPGPDAPFSLAGVSSDPCSLHAGVVVGRLLDAPDEDPIYSGEGRGDLVSPPSLTQGVTFQYDNCLRVRPHSGFASLPARWKKPGRKLEVLFPSDDIPVRGKPLPPVRCSLTVTMHDFVYLRLHDGKIVQVSQDFYQSKPALRVFLSGGAEAVKTRPVQLAAAAPPKQ
jgi:hypothetical protein